MLKVLADSSEIHYNNKDEEKQAASELTDDFLGGVTGGGMIPQEPAMLLSFINLKLRDYYTSLDLLCEDMELDRGEITKRLAGIDYKYDEERNQFV